MGDAPNLDPYEVVLADLKAQRAQIDQTIALLESLRGRPAAPINWTPPEASFLGSAPSSAPQAPSGGVSGPGAFLGLTIVDAAKKLLSHERRQMNNAEIVDAFKRGGLILNSKDELNTVGSVLNRRFIQVGDIVRVGRGTWGLKEWYPNRSFKTGKAGEAKEGAQDTPPETTSDFSNTFGATADPSEGPNEWDLDKGTRHL